MPRIAKGAKFIFGWSRIGEEGKIVIPDEAIEEYGLGPGAEVILVPGSKTSGGFGISPRKLLERSLLSRILKEVPELSDQDENEVKTARYKGRFYCRTRFSENSIVLKPEILELFGAAPGDRLLSIRSSDIAIGMAVRGPLIEKANQHPEIKTF